jgi:hypothetical protein
LPFDEIAKRDVHVDAVQTPARECPLPRRVLQ